MNLSFSLKSFTLKNNESNLPTIEAFRIFDWSRLHTSPSYWSHSSNRRVYFCFCFFLQIFANRLSYQLMCFWNSYPTLPRLIIIKFAWICSWTQKRHTMRLCLHIYSQPICGCASFFVIILKTNYRSSLL